MPLCGEKGGNSNGSLTATVPETVNLKLNMEVIQVNELLIQILFVLTFMYNCIKNNKKYYSRKGDFYYDEQQF